MNNQTNVNENTILLTVTNIHSTFDSVLDYGKQLAVFDKEFGVKGDNRVMIMRKPMQYYLITLKHIANIHYFILIHPGKNLPIFSELKE